MHELICGVCGKDATLDSLETAQVTSNVRAFRSEAFMVWRCPECACIHARDEVDLAQYYARYPFHAVRPDWRLAVVYAHLLARLRRAGLRREHRILDYGCGSGAFVAYLKSRGYGRSIGFDAYCPAFNDRTALGDRYDCIVVQDTIEHVASPAQLLSTLRRCTRPSALIAIGTPDAEAIDLHRARAFTHTLHAPFHRHILSGRALDRLAENVAWKLERRYRTMYTNTFIPGLNERFYTYYASLLDNTLDAILGPVDVGALLRRLPRTLYFAFFGALMARGTDTLALFRAPAH